MRVASTSVCAASRRRMVRMTEDRSGGGGGGGGGSRLLTRLPSTSRAGESRNAGTLTR